MGAHATTGPKFKLSNLIPLSSGAGAGPFPDHCVKAGSHIIAAIVSIAAVNQKVVLRLGRLYENQS